jgi:hypothetical protein
MKSLAKCSNYSQELCEPMIKARICVHLAMRE